MNKKDVDYNIDVKKLIQENNFLRDSLNKALRKLEDFKFIQQVKKKSLYSLFIIINVFWDVSIIIAFLVSVAIIHEVAKLLGVESSYFITVLNKVSETGSIIIFLILSIFEIFELLRLLRKGELT
jgi:negative regulator of genetic competence, sporulation and motility